MLVSIFAPPHSGSSTVGRVLHLPPTKQAPPAPATAAPMRSSFPSLAAWSRRLRLSLRGSNAVTALALPAHHNDDAPLGVLVRLRLIHNHRRTPISIAAASFSPPPTRRCHQRLPSEAAAIPTTHNGWISRRIHPSSTSICRRHQRIPGGKGTRSSEQDGVSMCTLNPITHYSAHTCSCEHS